MSMNRREMMVAGAAAVVIGARAAGAETKKPDARAALLAAVAECKRTGEVCVAHCLDELGQGNKAFANCNLRVYEMMALVESTGTLAALGSPLAKKQAELCAAAC